MISQYKILNDINNISHYILLMCDNKIQNNYFKELTIESKLDKSKKKITDDEFKIINPNEYELINTQRFKLCQLKKMCEYYKIKKTGNKAHIINQLYLFLKYYFYANTIQKYVRGFFLRKFLR